MSSIPTKQIDGDVAVGRNVSAGGDANVQGNVRVGHDLKVEGWLEAKNIKSANKGLFATAAALREAYPRPHDGWFAGVAASDKDIADLGLTVQQGRALFRMYVGSNEEWVCEPIDKLYEIVVDNEYASDLRTDLSTLRGQHEALAKRVDGHDTGIQGINSEIENLKKKAEKQEISISANTTAIDEITASKGVAGGIAPLGAEGRVPARHMPRLEANPSISDFVEGAEPLRMMSSVLASDDSGCCVVYDTERQRLLLQVSDAEGAGDPKYYPNWKDAYRYGTQSLDGTVPSTGIVYVHDVLDRLYRWDEENMRPVGSGLSLGESKYDAFQGSRGVALEKDLAGQTETIQKLDDTAVRIQEDVAMWKQAVNNLRRRVDGIAVLPFDGFYDRYLEENGVPPESGVWWRSQLGHGWFVFISPEYDLTAGDYNYTHAGSQYARGDRLYRCGAALYRADETSLTEIGGGSGDGNSINVTAEYPKTDTTDPYYSLDEAVRKVYGEKRAKLGVHITFAVGAESWKEYLYIGSDLAEENFTNPAKWKDMAGASAGQESEINVNYLCGEGPLAYGAYTLETAIAAVAAREEADGITYRKAGLKLTYKAGDGVWETRQLTQSAASFNIPGAWKDVTGGAGAGIVTSDEPAKDGADAFSTGGAYRNIPVNVVYDDSEPGVVKAQMVNAEGDPVGDETQFAVGTGSGDGGGTIVTLAFRDAPLYAAIGGSLATKVAIRSVTRVGSVESDNAIERLELIDKDTKATVWSSTVNRPSSGSMSDFSFDIDFSQFFAVAGQKTFTLVATDDTGHSGRKNITVIAEDLTLTCTQRLSETIAPTDTQRYVEMFAFANNQSAQGIRARVEILVGDEWKTVADETVTNAFSRPVVFDAVALGLRHGSYKLRMQGQSVASGVKGNTVYSTVMCVDPANPEMLIALRYDDRGGGAIRLFDTVSLDVAAYRVINGAPSTALVDIYAGDTHVTQVKIDPERVLNVRRQISGYTEGAEIEFRGRFGRVSSPDITLTVSGSVLDISLKPGASLDLDFSSRSNSETDHTISDHGCTMEVSGANWSSNGFVSYLGDTALRIAENVKATLPYAWLGATTVEQTGAVVQMKIATANIRDKDARLISCFDPESGAGFYVCGNRAAIFCKGGVDGRDGSSLRVAEREFGSGREVTLAFVVEPSSTYVERAGVKYSFMRLYIDGECQGVLGYVPGSGAVFSERTMEFDGTDGDLYLYYLMAYRTHYEWSQAFDNYLVKGTDTEAMVSEYSRENVLVSQTAEGTTAQRPSSAALWQRGIRYMVNVAPQEVFDKFDLGNGSDDNGLNTSAKFKGITRFFYDPVSPWRSFKATGVTQKRQGTTSAQRPVKNEDDDYSKAVITPLYPEYAADAELRASLGAEQLKDIEDTFALFDIGHIRIGANTMPIRKAMNKVDYSDSTCANNGGVCDMMNDTFRACGPDYLTPAQRFYDGTWNKKGVSLEGIELNHSIANFPCAIFRSAEDTLQNVWFHARGSYMESKKEQAALGFREVSGYNSECLNYGDFKELFTAPVQTLEQFVAAADKSTWEYPSDIEDPDSAPHDVIVISEYCGRNFRVFRRTGPGAEWKETTGSMKQANGRWEVSGDVVNPVIGFELLNYTGMCWWMGVASVDDMMKPESGTSSWVKKLVDKGLVSDTVFPRWTQFFECLIEDDQLAIDFATGRKVPYELFNTLRFFDSVDYSKPAPDWENRWRTEAWKYMSVQSVMAYHIFTDYLAAIDQRAKNMQPMWFLEDGCSIENGVFRGAGGMEPMRMYLNKVYDCDTCNGYDNDGGLTCDPEVDPDKPSDETEGYTNPYAGWGSVLFNDIAKTKGRLVRSGGADDKGAYPSVSLMTVAARMRSAQRSVGGRTLVPFSPEGAECYFLEQRIDKWPKKVCVYDCDRKYISRTATANKIYFYAYNGSGRNSLPQFIEKRWLVRDGFYQTGGFFAAPMSMRINCRPDAKIRITAGARGYYAVGYETPGQISGQAVFLEKGAGHEFSDFSHVDGTTLFIYQTARMSMLDLSDLTISGADFSGCALLENLRVGSGEHADVPLGSYPMQTALNLGSLPFLTTLNVMNTSISSADCSGCPRLAHVYAQKSQLAELKLAEASPINDIWLPATFADVRLVGLPALVYGSGSGNGLHSESLAGVRKLRVESSPRVDAALLLSHVLQDGKVLRSIRITGQPLKGNGSELIAAIGRGIKGMNAEGDENRPRPVIEGVYSLTLIRSAEMVKYIERGIEGISLRPVIEAFINLIDNVNRESYTGDSEVDTVTLDNIAEHLIYYNGETYEQYVARTAESDRSVHDIILL